MNKVVALMIVALLLGACGIQKRHYLKGYYVPGCKTHEISRIHEVKIKSFVPKVQTSHPVILPDEKAQVQVIAAARSLKGKVPAIITKKASAGYSFQQNLRRPHMQEAYNRKDVLPDDVPRAGFRLMLYGALFLGLAVGLFILYPELVYFAVSLLIISQIFAVVSMISSANARKDKVNNSVKGLKIALLSIIIDILITAGIVLFLILLF